ncbi:MAG: hypothetical protein Q7V62_03680 [Actinomycetota bacterium]|nr:hypothetical protein [Actinomycetota bacterium]
MSCGVHTSLPRRGGELASASIASAASACLRDEEEVGMLLSIAVAESA